MSRDDAHLPRILEWDCAFFGARIAALPLEARADEALERALRWCREERVDCLYALSDEADEPKRSWLERHGARRTDVRTTLSSSRIATAPAAGALRPAREADLGALEAVAAAAHTDSRFWNDHRFSRERCSALYATWIRNAVRGQADAVLVADADGAPAGYITCVARGAGDRAHGEIGLVAVAEAARGRGLGGVLVDGALAWAAGKGLERMEVVTQGRNETALRLYASRGFQIVRRQAWQHLWLDEAPA